LPFILAILSNLALILSSLVRHPFGYHYIAFGIWEIQKSREAAVAHYTELRAVLVKHIGNGHFLRIADENSFNESVLIVRNDQSRNLHN
jgi:hypothetical protein